MDFNLKVEVENLGKISKAEIEINRLTVFAGLNNTGKSYVSKFLYSFLDILNIDTGGVYLKQLITELSHKSQQAMLVAETNFIEFLRASSEPDLDKIISAKDFDESMSSTNNELRDDINNLNSLIRNTPYNELPNALDEFVKDRYVLELEKLQERQNKIETLIKKHPKVSKEKQVLVLMQVVKEVKEKLQAIIDYKKVYQDKDLVKKIHEQSLKHSLLHNFQMRDASKLIGKDKNNSAIVKILWNGGKNNKITCEISPDGQVALDYNNNSPILKIMGDYFSHVVYLESPIYWKLEKPLSRVERSVPSRFRSDNGKDLLSGVPKYFDDLVTAMEAERTGKPELSTDIEDKVGGKIVRKDGKKLVFQDKDGEYDLAYTATGVVQLAFVEFLIDTRVIQKNTVVFFDEPEAHLHPEWQQVMMNSLSDLTEQGVNIIFASHSPDNMQWIRNKLKQDESANNLIAVNHFKKDANIVLEKDKTITCGAILEELTYEFAKAFYDAL